MLTQSVGKTALFPLLPVPKSTNPNRNSNRISALSTSRFILRGRVEANVLHHGNGCSFELEICYLPSIFSKQTFDTPPKSILKNGLLNFNTPSSVSGNSTNSTPSSGNNNDNNRKQIDLLSKEKSFAFVGIKRKRLKGDSWCYKKVCEEVLSVATKDLKKSVTESVV